ncbi:NusG domain II-containing protein [Streptococcus oriscaviae]|uniref:NusG domain II-containing protein n=1 Tax=Streptococcus oriscaviae TaxID=2781599 RepID=A0ABX7YLH5_9STRE|nr:NusG domain II-containing protein [Streptococcus oriscaviae]QUE54084.1 NusG domain II-containing protein [Streptococcus oriscaviae]
MKSILQQFKPFDFILIGLALLLSFLPALWTYTSVQQEETAANPIALVKINGEVVDQFELSETTPHQEITYYPNPGQYNIVEIDGNRIRVKEDNSPDQIAVQTSWISQPGQLSVCLPHNLLIEIQAPDQEEEEDKLILPL